MGLYSFLIVNLSIFLDRNLFLTLTSLDRAKLAIDLRIIFPERVRGSAFTAAAILNDAIGPIEVLTRATNSSFICFSFFSASTKASMCIIYVL